MEEKEMMGVRFEGAVTFNGPMFDIHDNNNVYLNVEGAEEKMGRNVDKQADGMPKELQSNRARGMLGELVKEKLLKDNWQPAEGVAEWQLAVIAHKIGEELDIANFWQVFGLMWKRKPENLRSIYNRYHDTEAEIKFRKRLSKIA